MIEPVKIKTRDEPEERPAPNEALALVADIESAILNRLKALEGEPFTERSRAIIDCTVHEVLNGYKARGLYPLPYQYRSAVILTLNINHGIDYYTKDYVLQSQFSSIEELQQSTAKVLNNVKFKSARQLDYEARHGINT